MSRYLLRLVLVTGIFYFIFPLVPGVHFEGSFSQALLIGILLSLLGTFIEYSAIAFSARMKNKTFRTAFTLLVPAWIFGFGLLPVFTLMCLDFLLSPEFNIEGLLPAIMGGVLVFAVGVITGGCVHVQITKNVPKLVPAIGKI